MRSLGHSGVEEATLGGRGVREHSEEEGAFGAREDCGVLWPGGVFQQIFAMLFGEKRVGNSQKGQN